MATQQAAAGGATAGVSSSDAASSSNDSDPDPLLRPAISASAPVEDEDEGKGKAAQPRRMSASAPPKGIVTAAATSHTPTGLEFAVLFAKRFWTVGTTHKPAIFATIFCADLASVIKTIAQGAGLHSTEVTAKDNETAGSARAIGAPDSEEQAAHDPWTPRRYAPTSRGPAFYLVAMLVAAHTHLRTFLTWLLDAPLTLPRAHIDYYGPPQRFGQETDKSEHSTADEEAHAIADAEYETRQTAAANMSKPWTRSPKLTGVKPPMPECWGHRGASAAFPENTIASFEMAIRDGAEGLESDVHITSDDVVIMFHDPSLERTTDGSGLIREQPWHDNIDHVRTKAAPHQQIPTFHQVCELLMRPGNTHVKLNIDIKPENDPERLFRLMRQSVESFPNFEQDLSPRLILGLWHPIFLRAALQYVPTLRRVHIGGSPVVARTYFWKHCDGFSMWFPSLVGADGQNFLEQARRESKDVFVWTVNRRDEMIEATRWGVKAILTDETAMMQSMRREMNSDYATTRSERVGLFFRWATWRYWMLPQFLIQAVWISELEKRAGISFKQAWKVDSLQSNDPAAAVTDSASEDGSAASSDATAFDTEQPTLLAEKDAYVHDTQQPAATPAVVSAA